MKNLSKLFMLLFLAVLAAACNDEENFAVPEADAGDALAEESLLFDENEILDVLGLNNNSGFARSDASSSVLYTLSNEAAGNRVITFRAQPDGSIEEAGSYGTGGTGTDGGLGNQGALSLSTSGRLLFAVNAGSNELSAFYVQPDGGLYLIDTAPSEGMMPISITSHHGLIYVVNAGGSGNIAGFAFNRQGELVHIPNSAKPLSQNAPGPAQISFSPDGQALVVTEKGTNTLTAYPVRQGVAGDPSAFPSAGETPFGFSFGNGGLFYVSEAAGGAAGASTVSAYRIHPGGSISLVDGPFATGGSAACWVATANNGRTLFVTNTASDDITSLSVEQHGQLQLANDGMTTPAFDGPIDAATDRNSRYLYTLGGANDAILTYRIGRDGALEQIDTDEGLPSGTTGLVVR